MINKEEVRQVCHVWWKDKPQTKNFWNFLIMGTLFLLLSNGHWAFYSIRCFEKFQQTLLEPDQLAYLTIMLQLWWNLYPTLVPSECEKLHDWLQLGKTQTCRKWQLLPASSKTAWTESSTNCKSYWELRVDVRVTSPEWSCTLIPTWLIKDDWTLHSHFSFTRLEWIKPRQSLCFNA